VTPETGADPGRAAGRDAASAPAADPGRVRARDLGVRIGSLAPGPLNAITVGGSGAHSSGDLFVAFSTGNRGMRAADTGDGPPRIRRLDALDDAWIPPLFWAVIGATEEAIVNALVAAQTMTGIDGVTAQALPHDRLRAVMARYASVRQYSDGT